MCDMPEPHKTMSTAIHRFVRPKLTQSETFQKQPIKKTFKTQRSFNTQLINTNAILAKLIHGNVYIYIYIYNLLLMVSFKPQCAAHGRHAAANRR